jgi:hypothetical protein
MLPLAGPFAGRFAGQPAAPLLQALSKRIHYGKFVAEAKFQAQPEKYSQLISQRDSQGILDLLTDRAVELKAGRRCYAGSGRRGRCCCVGGDNAWVTPHLVRQWKGTSAVGAVLHGRTRLRLSRAGPALPLLAFDCTSG